MSCYICGSIETKNRPGSVRGEPEVNILECVDCGLVYLSSIAHIDESHYEDSGMHANNVPNIEGWLELTQKDDERRFNFLKSKIKNKKILDFGCGIGGFIQKAQELGSLVKGVELEVAIQDSFKERNLSVYPDVKSAIHAGIKWDLITTFHVFEHLLDPLAMLNELSLLLAEGGEIIIEVPNSDDALLVLYKNKGFQNFVYWSQHIYVFNELTLKALIEKSGLRINWTKHIQRYPLSNHLYWLANNKPQGHEIWDFINDTDMDQKYEEQLAKKNMTDTIIMSVGFNI